VATTYSVQASQIGLTLYFPNTTTGLSSACFTGTTISLMLTDANGIMETYGPLDIDPIAGGYCWFTTLTGDELSVVGNYSGQLTIEAVGEQFNSQIFTIKVQSNL